MGIFSSTDCDLGGVRLLIFEIPPMAEHKESNLSVRAIVESVGYVDIASFNRKFKKYHGISPTDYRKNYRLDQSSETEGEETVKP